MISEAAKGQPQVRLDAVLYGQSQDTALEDVPSIKNAAQQATFDKSHLPIVNDCYDAEAPPCKKRRSMQAIAWPTLHKEMLKTCGVTWLCFAIVFFDS